MKKPGLTLILLLISIYSGLYAQDSSASNEKKEKMLVRPLAASASHKVEEYVTKAFEAYDESKKISADLEFIKIVVKEIPDKGDGVTTEVKITNGKGESLTKEKALIQLADLMRRAVQQNENIQLLSKMKSEAADEIKTLSMLEKPRAGKNLSKGGEAEAVAVTESKKQIDIIQQQISTIKAIKEN